MTMQFKNWVKTYKPLIEGDQVKYFDTYGKDVEFLNKQNPLCIWTVSDWGYPKRRIVNGARLVNRLYYCVTEIPFQDKEEWVIAHYGTDVPKNIIPLCKQYLEN